VNKVTIVRILQEKKHFLGYQTANKLKKKLVAEMSTKNISWGIKAAGA
jgi:hypothetical protein